jgi:hypothetical protein
MQLLASGSDRDGKALLKLDIRNTLSAYAQSTRGGGGGAAGGGCPWTVRPPPGRAGLSPQSLLNPSRQPGQGHLTMLHATLPVDCIVWFQRLL